MSNHISLTLGGNEYDLVPSLKAATAVSTRFNGFNNALTAVAQNDLASTTYVIRQGIKASTISTEDLTEAVYLAGTRNLGNDTMRYITRLANGGRDPEETDEAEDKAGED